MTAADMSAAIRAAVEKDSRLETVRKRMAAGTAGILDSELFAAIVAEVTAEELRDHIIAMDDRGKVFMQISREQFAEIVRVFTAVQDMMDELEGIKMRPVAPRYQTERAKKIANALEDQTVPDSTIRRRAFSATENFLRAAHDNCVRVNAEARSRAGYDTTVTRIGGAKCCDWCASVTGSFRIDSAPAGIWGRHDNCKCDIIYQSKRGYQTLTGRSDNRGWRTMPEDEEMPWVPVHRVTDAQAAELSRRHDARRMTPEQTRKAMQTQRRTLTAEQISRALQEPQRQHPQWLLLSDAEIVEFIEKLRKEKERGTL